MRRKRRAPREARAGSAIELGDCACLRLRKITRRVTQLYDRFLEQSGLTAAQFGLLSFIAGTDRISIGKLAAELVADPTTLTRNLQPLERARYVEVLPDPADRRRRTVALTRGGRAVLREAMPLWRQAQARVLSLVGERRLATLKASLDQALERLERG